MYIASKIAKYFHDNSCQIENIESGFINIRLAPHLWHHLMMDMIKLDTQYGTIETGKGEKVVVKINEANQNLRNIAFAEALTALHLKGGYSASLERVEMPSDMVIVSHKAAEHRHNIAKWHLTKNVQVSDIAPAVRLMLLAAPTDQYLVINFDLLRKLSRDNLYFYVQYIGVRASAILKETHDSQSCLETTKLALVSLKLTRSDIGIIKLLSRWPNIVEQVCENGKVYLVVAYLKEIAAKFYEYLWKTPLYHCSNNHYIDLQLMLTKAVANTVNSALATLGISLLEEI
jgi:arginyl-tRNA synthetase